jgi:glycosyltransferase involved in cell wall biosynthesis
MKVAYISNHPAPYRDYTLKALSLYPGIELKVFQLSDFPANHPEWSYSSPLEAIYLKKKIKVPLIGEYPKGLISNIIESDVIIVSGFLDANLIVCLYAYIKRIPIIISSDKTKQLVRRGLISQFLRNRLQRYAKAFWVPGERSKEFYISAGIPREKIYLGLYTNDIQRISHCLEQNARDYHQDLAIEKDSLTFLFVGKLIPNRKISDLISAFNYVVNKNKKIRLIIIGDGPDSNLIPKREDIIYLPSVPLNKLYWYYHISDVYVHPGAEPFSLAVADAAKLGKVVIASKDVGASKDFIEDGVNGYVTDGTVQSLKEAMMNVLNNMISFNTAKIYGSELCIRNSVEWAASQLFLAITK